VERFHQSLKKHLAKQEPATIKKLLQGQLNRFVAGLDVQILGIDGSPLRHLTLDPSVDYQRIP